jgi:putative inorganic carbon (hco3(-)) transporter
VVGLGLVAWSLTAAGAWVNLVVILALIGVGCVTIIVAQAGPALTLSLGLALTIVSGHWGDVGSPIPFDRLVLAIGLGGVMLRPDMRKDVLLRLRQPVSLLLAAVALYTIVSAWRAGTLTSSDGSFALLDSLGLIPFALYVVAPVVFRTAKDRDILLGSLVAVGAYLGVTALFETIGLKSLVFPRYILDEGVGIHFDRARGPFTEAAANGLAMYGCGVAATIAAYRWRGQRRTMIAVLAIALCAAGTLFTLTRAVWLGSLLATLLALLLFKPLRRYFLPATGLAALLAVASLVVVPGLASEAQERQSDLRPVWDRLNTNAAALRMVEARPLTGFGWNTYAEASIPYMHQADTYPLTGAGLDVHNVFLARFAELGLIGGTLWVLALCVAIGGTAIRAGPASMFPWRVGLVAIAINWLIVANFVPLTFAFPNALLWFWAGLVSTLPNGID